MPTITKARNSGLAGSGPAATVNVPKNEIRKLPATLMITVPHGNAAPHQRAAATLNP